MEISKELEKIPSCLVPHSNILIEKGDKAEKRIVDGIPSDAVLLNASKLLRRKIALNGLKLIGFSSDKCSDTGQANKLEDVKAYELPSQRVSPSMLIFCSVSVRLMSTCTVCDARMITLHHTECWLV